MLKQVVLFLPSLFLFVAHADEVVIDSALQATCQAIVDQAVADGEQGAVQFCAYRDGKRIVDVFAGTMTTNAGAERISATTLFPIFSTEKPLLATAVHRAVEQGFMDYDKPLSTWWPELTGEGKEKLTLGLTLGYRSGLPARLDKTVFPTIDDVCDWQKVCRWAAAVKPELEPGTKQRYMSLSYGWYLGHPLEVALGKPLNEALVEQVLKPCGIEHDFYFAANDAAIPRIATVYKSDSFERMNDDRLRRYCLPSAYAVANARAIARFYNRLCGFDGKAPLIRPETLEQALKPCRHASDPLPDAKTLKEKWFMIFGMGYGLWGDPDDLSRVFGHGGLGGSEGLCERRKRVTVGFTCNFDQNSSRLRQRLYEAVGLKWRYWKDEVNIQDIQMRSTKTSVGGMVDGNRGNVVPAAVRGAWFREARFGMFIHWGIYSVPGKGEWSYAHDRYAPGEYEAYARTFNPTKYDPYEWARLAKAAGMKYAVLTSRHHDGFCMFDSHFTDYKITKTPYGKDAVREFLEAFRAEGLKVGLYHSLPDWTHPGYADTESPECIAGGRKTPHVPTASQYSAFTNLVYNHINQLTTEYGKIDLLFLDYTSRTKADSDYFGRDRILEMVYRNQPDILVNDRLSYFKENCRDFDYYTPEICVPNQPQKVKEREVMWETCATMNDHWGFCRADENWKDSSAVVAGLVGCVSKNGNLLLNVGPNERGELPTGAVKILRSLADWHRANGEAISGCGKSDLTPPHGCVYTQRGNVLYCHFLQSPLGDTILPQLKGRFTRATLLRTGQEIKLVNDWGFELLKNDEQRLRTRGIRPGDVVRIDIEDTEPGVVKVCWSEKDGVRWEVKGLADRETGRLMATNTVFAIASNTKPIASVLVLSLVEEGVLDLNAPVAQYLPEMTNITFEGRPPDRPILLRHLITHLSGLPYLYKDPVHKPDRVPYSEHVAFAIRRGLRTQPGVAYRYCGLGFQVMGAVIERVTGRRIADLMKERIFDPLEMFETTFYPNAEMLSRAAPPYYYPPSGGNPVYFGFGRSNSKPLDDTTRTALLSGGLFSTAVDYLKFSQMIARKGIGMNGRRILSEATFERWLLTRQTPPGDVKDASFDIQFNKDHTGGGKGGYWGTHAYWNWAEKSCEITFRAKSPNPPGRKEGVNLQDVPIPPMEAN